ncbi:hypothetical protein [Robertkochia flava]|uniref:hypothetical protein n=1 Tax=Robertkochia flava TaxID=3447986 RepID=UPI001CCAD886|nr:hypothetical protein [Robertkochia marina]
MKTLKSLFIHIFSMAAILMVTSCVKEETSYAFQDVSAPTDLAVAFDIAQDDSGNVTVTPTASGATSFMIYFGDTEDETPVVVAPGESADHTYAEGVYTMKVVAEGMTGLTSELNKEVNISFTKPSNLILDIQTTNLTANITPSAENAAAYDVYFGAAEDEEPATIMDGETASFTYAEEGAYTIRVVARGASSQTTETSIILNISITTSETLSLPLNFESETLTYPWGGFGGANPSIVSNPDVSAGNASNTVLQLEKTAGSEVWAGASMALDEPMDFSAGTEVAINVWSPRAGTPILLKIENSSNPDINAEVSVSTTKAGEWETLVFDMATSAVGVFDAANTYDVVVVFGDFGTNGQGENFYFDDFLIPSSSSIPVGLPLYFESPVINYAWGGFGGANPSIIDNPDMSGINTSGKVLQLEKTAGSEVWAGAALALDVPMDFSAGSTVAMKVWSPRAGIPVLFKMEKTGDPNTSAEVSVNTTKAGEWELLIFDMSTSTVGTFDPSIDYGVAVVFADFGTNGQGENFYFDDILVPSATQYPLGLPLGFESLIQEYPWTGFGNANASIVDNPDMSGENTSNRVLQLEKTAGAEVWAGAVMGLDRAIDFSTSSVITIKVWSPRAGTPILFKMEDSSDPSNLFAEVSVSTTTAGARETLSFDMSNPSNGSFDAANSYDTIVVFGDFGTAGQGENFYFDDIQKQ